MLALVASAFNLTWVQCHPPPEMHAGVQVLRTHRTTLISVLETFVHDPLVEWTHNHRTAEDMEQGNPQAQDAMATIEGAPVPWRFAWGPRACLAQGLGSHPISACIWSASMI